MGNIFIMKVIPFVQKFSLWAQKNDAPQFWQKYSLGVIDVGMGLSGASAKVVDELGTIRLEVFPPSSLSIFLSILRNDVGRYLSSEFNCVWYMGTNSYRVALWFPAFHAMPSCYPSLSPFPSPTLHQNLRCGHTCTCNHQQTWKSQSGILFFSWSQNIFFSNFRSLPPTQSHQY